MHLVSHSPHAYQLTSVSHAVTMTCDYMCDVTILWPCNCYVIFPILYLSNNLKEKKKKRNINIDLDSQHAKNQMPHKTATSKLTAKQQANLKSPIKDINEQLNSIRNCFNPLHPLFTPGSQIVDHFSSRISFLSQKVTYLFCDELKIVSKELMSRVRQATKDVVKSEV